MPWRLWAMLVQLLVEPWSTGYHHPYHNSPKLRKIQQPEGKSLQFWTIQRRLWNSANTERSKATSSITRTDALILLSTNPWYRGKKTKQRRTWKAQRVSRLESPRQSHHGSIRPFYTHHAFAASRFTALTPCFQLHDKKQRPFKNMIKTVELGSTKGRERQM